MADYSKSKIRLKLEDEKSNFVEKLGSRIRQVRLHSNLTQTEFARMLGIGKKSLSEIENCEKQPSGRFMCALSSYFPVNIDWLISGKGEMLVNKKLRKGIDDSMQFLKLFNRLPQIGRGRVTLPLKLKPLESRVSRC